MARKVTTYVYERKEWKGDKGASPMLVFPADLCPAWTRVELRDPQGRSMAVWTCYKVKDARGVQRGQWVSDRDSKRKTNTLNYDMRYEEGTTITFSEPFSESAEGRHDVQPGASRAHQFTLALQLRGSGYTSEVAAPIELDIEFDFDIYEQRLGIDEEGYRDAVRAMIMKALSNTNSLAVAARQLETKFVDELKARPIHFEPESNEHSVRARCLSWEQHRLWLARKLLTKDIHNGRTHAAMIGREWLFEADMVPVREGQWAWRRRVRDPRGRAQGLDLVGELRLAASQYQPGSELLFRFRLSGLETTRLYRNELVNAHLGCVWALQAEWAGEELKRTPLAGERLEGLPSLICRTSSIAHGEAPHASVYIWGP